MVPKFSDDRISGFLDGVLEADEAADLRREIGRDPELKQLVEELRQARGEVQSLPRHRLGPDFTARVMAAVQQAAPPAPLAAQPTTVVKVTAPSKPWKAFALGALAASLVALGVFVFVPRANGPSVVEKPDPTTVAVQPIASGVITLGELKSALAAAQKQPGQLFTARVTMKTSDLKAGELDRVLVAHGMVVSPAAQQPQVTASVAKVWDELAADKAAGLTDSLASVREVFYVEANPQAIDAAVASLAKTEALQIASAVSRIPAGSENLLAAANLPNPNQAEGEALNTNNVGKPAAGSVVRMGRRHIFQELGRQDSSATPSADGMSDVLLLIRVR